MAGPTLDDVTKANCPDDLPYKCLPSGTCYGHDSYCNPESQAVESCFPHNLSTVESYCQNVSQNLTRLLHSSCRFACMTISERSNKSVSEMAGPTLDDVTKANCPDDLPYKCLPSGTCYGPDSYCNPKSQAVESCFPHHLSTVESKLAYCQDISQNLTQLLHSSCRYACMTISERSDKSVSESSSGDLKWQIIAIVAIIFLAVLLVERFTQKTKWRKEMCQKVTLLCQNTSTDDYVPALECPNGEEPENNDVGFQAPIANDHDLEMHMQHPVTLMDLDEVTQPETRILNPPQQNSTPQHVLETINGNPQLQQPSVNNTVHEEMPSSCDSLLNGSNISSPASVSSSSVSTSNDSGVSSGREGRIDRENLAQQSSQTCVMTNQICGFNEQSKKEHRADASFHRNTSTPDAENSLVTSVPVYRD